MNCSITDGIDISYFCTQIQIEQQEMTAQRLGRKMVHMKNSSKKNTSKMSHGGEIRGSSNKEWDFFYSAVNLHARLMKYHTYLVYPFGSSRATFLS